MLKGVGVCKMMASHFLVLVLASAIARQQIDTRKNQLVSKKNLLSEEDTGKLIRYADPAASPRAQQGRARPRPRLRRRGPALAVRALMTLVAAATALAKPPSGARSPSSSHPVAAPAAVPVPSFGEPGLLRRKGRIFPSPPAPRDQETTNRYNENYGVSTRVHEPAIRVGLVVCLAQRCETRRAAAAGRTTRAITCRLETPVRPAAGLEPCGRSITTDRPGAEGARVATLGRRPASLPGRVSRGCAAESLRRACDPSSGFSQFKLRRRCLTLPAGPIRVMCCSEPGARPGGRRRARSPSHGRPVRRPGADRRRRLA